MDQPQPAGVDPLLAQGRHHRDVEVGAMRAGERGVVDQGVGRVRLAQDVIAGQRVQKLVARQVLGAQRRGRRKADPSAPSSTCAPAGRDTGAQAGQRGPELGILHRSGPFGDPRHGCGVGRGRGLGRGPRGDRRPAPGGCRRSSCGRNRRSRARPAGRSCAGSRAPKRPERAGEAPCRRHRAPRPASNASGWVMRARSGPTMAVHSARRRAIEAPRPPFPRSGDAGCEPLGQTADGAEAVFPHGPFQTPFLMVGHGPLHDHDPRPAFARLVRPTSSHPAVARAGRRAHPALPGLAVGDHAAADHRGHGRRLFPPLRRALAHGRGAGRGAARRACSRPGPASATTPAPAISMPAPAPWSSATAGASPRTRRACWPCPASAATRPAPSAPSPSTSRPRRSTAMSSG